MQTTAKDDAVFLDALQELHRGDFSRLEPLFDAGPEPGSTPRIIEWHEQGLFRNHPQEVAEALSAASFLGKTKVMEYLLAQGVDPAGGSGTGLDAFHWAANRGQLDAVRLFIRAKAPLETRNNYGGTVLSRTVFAAFHEPRPTHLEIIEELLEAGARAEAVDYPTGNERIDSLLQRTGRPDRFAPRRHFATAERTAAEDDQPGDHRSFRPVTGTFERRTR